MKKVPYLLGLALLVSMIAFMGFATPVRAYVDEDEQWGNYCHASVTGTYPRILYEYYHVYHDAGIYECLRGRYHFVGQNRTGVTLYSQWGYLGPPDPMEIEWTSGLTYKIWVAYSEVWAPYYYPPSPYMEHIVAWIGPPGSR